MKFSSWGVGMVRRSIFYFTPDAVYRLVDSKNIEIRI